MNKKVDKASQLAKQFFLIFFTTKLVEEKKFEDETNLQTTKMCDYTRERLREREALITEQKFGLKKGEKNTRRRQ